MSRILVCIVSISVFYINASSCNSLIRVPSVTSTNNKECGTEGFLEKAKCSIKVALDPSRQFNITDAIRPILLTENYGSCTQGNIWDDGILSHQPTIVGIRHVSIFYRNQINSIQVTYLLFDGTLYNAPRHGSSIGYSVSITLNEDERFIRVEGMESASVITQLIFISKNSSGIESTHGPFGGPGETSFSIGGYILGFLGYASTAVHGLKVYYLSPLTKSQEAIGGSGRASPFDDNVDAIIPPVIGIKSINIRHGLVLDSIQCNYIQLGGSVFEGERHGGNGGNPSTVILERYAVLHRLVTKTSGTYVCQLILYTTLQNNSEVHGPYGSWSTGGVQELSGKIIGFYGYIHPQRYRYIARIGVYTV